MKKIKNKQGFTLVELLAVIIILSVITVITVFVVGSLIEQAKMKKYHSEEKAMERAATSYIVKEKIKDENNIGLKTLVDNNYMKAVHDSGDGGVCYGTGKDSKVLVSYGENDDSFSVTACLQCSNYETQNVNCDYEMKVIDENPCELATETKNSKKYYYIDSEEDLYAFSKSVNEGHDYSGEIVTVRNDLDMSKLVSGTSKTTCDNKGVTTTSFAPIGTPSKPFKGTFEGGGKTISNLTINLPSQDNVGLFGYNSGTIRGFNLLDVNITGKNYVGAVAGNSVGRPPIVNEISITGSIKGCNYVGGAVGNTKSDSGTGYVSNILVNASIEATSGDAAGISGYLQEGQAVYVTGVVEGGTIKAYSEYSRGTIPASNYIGSIYASNLVKVYASDGLTLNGSKTENYQTITNFLSNHTSRLNGYDYILDTYLGGDNDSSGYYFDYDSNEKIKVIATASKPIPSASKLKGSGTSSDPYEIGSVSDWNIAVANPKGNYYKLTSDIDFNNKRFYMLGNSSNITSNDNSFTGSLYGDGHTIKNANIEGINYTGLIGYNSGTLEYLNTDNVTISGEDYTGTVGYNTNKILGMNITNVDVSGKNYVGAVAGNSVGRPPIVNEISITGSIKGCNYVGGAVGNTKSDSGTGYVSNILVNASIEATSGDAAGISGYLQEGQAVYVTGVVEGGTIKAYSEYSRGTIPASNKIGGEYVTNYVKVYASDGLTLKGSRYESYNTITNFLNAYHNNLSRYATYGLETPQTGDTNGTGYYFDYNGDASDIIVVKAYQISGDDDQHSTTDVTPIIHTSDSCSDNVAPTCTLTSFAPRSQRDGMTASFECTDDVDVEKISSYFHSTRKNTAESFDMIGTEKTITAADKFDKGAKHYSIWTAQTDPSHPPYSNTCYYFHYGAKDACGNYTAYVTNYCLSY